MKITAKVKTTFFLVLGIVFFFISCTDNTIYHQYANIDKNGWDQDSVAVFSVDIQDTTGDYDVIIDVRNKENYSYQNLYLFVYSNSPDSIWVGDTLNCILADNQGRWAGTGIGSTKNLPFLYMSNIKFPEKGTYTFKIKQGMRDHILEGINNIGLKIQKTENYGQK